MNQKSRSVVNQALVSFMGALVIGSPAFSVQSEKPARVLAFKVEPPAIILSNARDARRVVVSGRLPDGSWIDLTRAARFTPPAGLVRLDREGYFSPMKAGRGQISISAAGKTARIPVTVASASAPPVSFVRDVMPVLAKSGCNAGTCHGAAAGKNGFKLSLRGYDPDFDYHSLIDDLSGRRFNRADPEASLMLLKPVEGVPHQGGLVWEKGSPQYRLIDAWIREGVKSDTDKTARVNRLEVLPNAPRMNLPGQEQQLVVIAHYPDGASRDVTRDAVFTSSMADIATVSPEGLVTATRRGETAILVRYEGQFAVDNITILGDRTGYRWAGQPQFNYVDGLIDAKLQRIKAVPAPLCTDEEFIRRAYLDLTGLPPGPDAVRAFLADKTETRAKRAKLVDHLLNSSAYADHWTNKWSDLLEVNRKFLNENGVWAFRNWIHDAVAKDRPYDQFVRELLTARGDSLEYPAANYMRICREPPTATENVTQLFLGVRFSCNKCHDHPFERWTQTQYYQFAAFFARVGYKDDGNGAETVYDLTNGEVNHPKGGRAVPPAVPIGTVGTPGADGRREALAKWITSADNPFFAKAMANRLWSYLLGRGIIDPVDDIRSGNPPSNPELLDALTKDFVKSGFSVRHLLGVIANSRTYQQSIATNRWNVDDAINFSHQTPRRLSAEQLLDSISVATGSMQKYPGVPIGFHAQQLPDTKVATGGFLDLFGRPPRESPCECERSSAVSLSQALNLINGPTIADAIADPNGRIARLMKTNPDDRKIIEEVYLSALCRMPRADEIAKCEAHFKSAKSKLDGAQDLMWALINSPAFLFNR